MHKAQARGTVLCLFVRLALTHPRHTSTHLEVCKGIEDCSSTFPRIQIADDPHCDGCAPLGITCECSESAFRSYQRDAPEYTKSEAKRFVGSRSKTSIKLYMRSLLSILGTMSLLLRVEVDGKS